LARRQAGRGDGDAEPHRVAIGHEHERGAARLTGDGDDGEAAPEEGMGRVGYLDLLGRELGRVVDGGIKAGLRSTTSTTRSCCRSSGRKSKITGSWPWSKGCSRPDTSNKGPTGPPSAVRRKAGSSARCSRTSTLTGWTSTSKGHLSRNSPGAAGRRTTGNMAV
jgi:hypothetical protein